MRLETLGFSRVYDYTTGKADWTSSGWPSEGNAIPARALDVARRDVPTCRPGDRIGDIRAGLEAAGERGCIVTDDRGVVLGRLRGEALAPDPDATAVSVMEPGPTSVRADRELDSLVEVIARRKVGSILVTTPEGVLLGVLSRKDAEDHLARLGRNA